MATERKVVNPMYSTLSPLASVFSALRSIFISHEPNRFRFANGRVLTPSTRVDF
jgi:hypothetical protein